MQKWIVLLFSRARVFVVILSIGSGLPQNLVAPLFVFLFGAWAFAKPVQISWKPIENAAFYEIQIEKDEAEVLTEQIKTTSWSGDLPYGHYSYRVRAWDTANRAGEWSTQYSLKVVFDIDREAELVAPTRLISLQMAQTNFDYQVKGPTTSKQTLRAALDSSALAVGVEHWLSSERALGMVLGGRSYQALEERFDESEIDLHMKKRTLLGTQKYPWTFYLSGGVLSRKYSFIIPTQDGRKMLTSSQHTASGPAASIELRKQVTAKVHVAGQFHYFLPLLGGTSWNNWSLGVHSTYWHTEEWGVSLGFFQEARALMRSATGGTENVGMQGSQVFIRLTSKFNSKSLGRKPQPTPPD